MSRYRTLIDNLGAVPRAGADEAALARVEKSLGARLPQEFREFYRTTDGLDIPGGRMEILPLSGVERYAGVLAEGFGYVPFADCNDSNPYALCTTEPLTGYIAHVFHDDESVLVCDTLGRFLELVAEGLQRMLAGDEVDLRLYRLEGDLAFDRPERSADHARVGRALVRHAEGLDLGDYGHGEALRYAAQLFGPGDEDDLAGLLALGDEYVREAVLRRCGGLDTPAAREVVRDDAQAFRRFVAELAGAIEAAGIEVRRQPGSREAWTVEPGRIGLNLPMLYAQRHAPDFLPDLLARIRRRQAERKR